MKRNLFTILICSAVSFAQDQAEPSKAPATKLEAFQARTGVVLIRGFSIVGSLLGETFYVGPGLGGRSVVVQAREFRDGSDPNSPGATGISITVKETTGLYRENTSYIDVDEIDSLVKGIEYVSKASKDVTKLDQFEVEYRTKGDLRIIVFTTTHTTTVGVYNTMAAISSGTIGRTTAYLKVADLGELRDLIVAAKAKL